MKQRVVQVSYHRCVRCGYDYEEAYDAERCYSEHELIG